MRFYLSKADEAGHETDRQRVMMQVVQELCKRPTLNRTGFDMPTIFIPNPDKVRFIDKALRLHIMSYFNLKPTRCVNQIDDVCRDVEKTINQTIQTTLNQLEKDCNEIGSLVDSSVEVDNAARAYNLRAGGKGFLLLFLGCTLPIALAINFFASSLSDKLLRDMLGKDGMDTLKMYLVRRRIKCNSNHSAQRPLLSFLSPPCAPSGTTCHPTTTCTRSAVSSSSLCSSSCWPGTSRGREQR
jgi:hypothetical protein